MPTQRRGAANRRKKIMEPKYVVYECENCGKLFYREVAEVLTDDGAHCEVNVALLDYEGEKEEFPMCGCLGGNADYMIAHPSK